MIAKKAKIVTMFTQVDNEVSNFYNDDFLDQSLEDDQISAAEEGFMIGYMGDCYV